MIGIEVMAPLMFAGLVLFLLIGYPVAFSLSAVGLAFGVVGIHQGFFQPALLQAMPERVFGTMSNQILLAIPFFTFMGSLLERCGIAEDLLEAAGQLFGAVRGGLAYSVILVGALLAAISGTVAASVIAMGLISLPVMLRHGYDPRLATGVVAASGTIAQIIPPSLVLIILADVLGRSVGDMYAGAFLPSFVLVGLFALYVFGVTLVKPAAAPPLAPEARSRSAGELLRGTLVSLVPPVALMFVVLGTILLGWATPTEAGAMGAVGALALAIAKRRLTGALLRQGMDTTLKITTMVIFILIGSQVFSLVFRGVDGDLWIERLLTSLPGGVIGFLLFVNLLVFLLAFFLDFFEIAFIVVPLLAPVAEKLGIDLVWFGVMLGVNMQTSFMHPPFGFALFYLRSVAPPQVRSADIYWGAVPWVLIQLVMVGLVIAFPELVTRSVEIFGRN
ncbi:MAG TPA: TRAP transporter large permease subunit [Burkholderiales bacterium]|nr:TRAP transporter large permease subunit [Burkholderiales bacterium]